MNPITIIGGGYSGMVLAYSFARAGFKVNLYEAKGYLGGVLGTFVDSDGQIYEQAAHGFLATHPIEAMLEDIGCPYESSYPMGSKKWFYSFNDKKNMKSKFLRWPLTPLETLSSFSLIKSLKNKDYKGSKSLNEFKSKLSARKTRVIEKFFEPALQGIYGGQTGELDPRLVFTKFSSQKYNSNQSKNKSSQAKNKGSLYPVGGMRVFVNKMQEHLVANNVTVYKNKSVNLNELLIEDKKTVYFTGPLHALNMFIETPLLINSYYKPATMAVVYLHEEQNSIDGYGALFRQKKPGSELGVIFNSKIFPKSYKSPCEAWIFDGFKEESEVIEEIESIRKTVFNSDSKVLKYKVTPWENAFPHYSSDLSHALKSIEKSTLGFELFGNYTGNVGLSSILAKALQLAEEKALEI